MFTLVKVWIAVLKDEVTYYRSNGKIIIEWGE